MTHPYPLLEALVTGRDVAVVAKNPKCSEMTFPGQIVVRFNNDIGLGDIWATRLHHGMNERLHQSCSLVIVPRVEANEQVQRQVAEMEPPLTRPIQYEQECYFQELMSAIRAQPTTGLLVLAMLSRTSLRSCTLYGFDAHITPDPRVDLKGFSVQHAPVRELRYLRSFLRREPRFTAGTHCSLVWPEVVWLTLLPLRFLKREIPEVWKYLKEHGLQRTLQRTVYVLTRRFRKERVAKTGEEGEREKEVFEN